MRKSDVIHEAIRLMERGDYDYCCIAITRAYDDLCRQEFPNGIDHITREIIEHSNEYLNELLDAFERMFKPADRSRRGAWWISGPPEAQQFRIAALRLFATTL